MKVTMKKGICVLLFSVLITSCIKDSASKTDNFIPTSCSDTIFFNTEVRVPIIDKSCNVVNCHDSITAAYNIDYSTFDKIVPITHGLYKSMAHDSGFIPMPPASPRLNNSLLQKCYCWIQQGKLNN